MESDLLTKLAELRARHCDQMPTPQMAVLTRLTARLRRSGILNRCLQPGETAPDFTFIDNGHPASLYELLAEGPVVLNFFRGLWCPYCRTEFEAFDSISNELANLGCRYLAITPQRIPSTSSGDRGYCLVYDEDNAIAKRFDLVYTLLDEEHALFRDLGVPFEDIASAGRELPLPATYLIAVDRTVAWQFVDVDFRSRCCPDELLEEVRSLPG